MKSDREFRFATLAVHAGQDPDPTTGAVMPPIYQTSTYAQESFGVHKGYDYSRGANPTRSFLEKNVAALEGAVYGAAFASGLASIEAMIKRYSVGDHIISGANVYGGTDRMFRQVFAKLGLEFRSSIRATPTRSAKRSEPRRD